MFVHEQRAAYVDGQRLVPHLDGLGSDGCVPIHEVAGDRVVVDDVEPSEALDGGCDGLLHLGFVSEIDFDGDDIMAGVSETFGQFGVAGARTVGERDCGSVLRQSLGRDRADPAGCAGCERDLPARLVPLMLAPERPRPPAASAARRPTRRARRAFRRGSRTGGHVE